MKYETAESLEKLNKEIRNGKVDANEAFTYTLSIVESYYLDKENAEFLKAIRICTFKKCERKDNPIPRILNYNF